MRIVVFGCAGKTGKEILQLIIAEHNIGKCKLVGGIVTPDSLKLGQDLGVIVGGEEIGIKSISKLESVIESIDVVVDFTIPETSLKNAELCAKHNVKLVCGTTGFSEEQLKQLQDLAKKTVIFLSPNMSVGVNLLAHLVEKTARLLDESYDIEILEMHHNRKKDAPSGTALMLGEVARRARDKSKDAMIFSRQGEIGPRKKGQIGYAVLRGGDVVGEHSVIFAGSGERIELVHKASDMKIFAQGAVRAAYWVEDKLPGKIYTMEEMLYTVIA